MNRSLSSFLFVASTTMVLLLYVLGTYFTRGYKSKVRIFLWGFLTLTVVLQWVVPLWMSRTGDLPPGTFGHAVVWAGMTGLGFLALLTFLSIFGFLGETWAGRGMDGSRRAMLSRTVSGAVGLSAVGLTGAGMFAARRGPIVRTVPIIKNGLHPDLDGYKIVQISDLHVGTTIRRAYVQHVVDLVSDCKPDMICMTGDIGDGNADLLRNDLEPIASMRAPGGVFFVTGNHELYWDVKAWLRVWKEMGVTCLENTHQLVPHRNAKLVVMGVHDLHAEQWFPELATNPEQAMKGAPIGDFRLMLSHQPKSVERNAKAGEFDLQLSGHTHAGQFFPVSLVIPFVHKYWKGLYSHTERHRIYVNPATGYWGAPNRLGQRGEITQFVLSRT